MITLPPFAALRLFGQLAPFLNLSLSFLVPVQIQDLLPWDHRTTTTGQAEGEKKQEGLKALGLLCGREIHYPNPSDLNPDEHGLVSSPSFG